MSTAMWQRQPRPGNLRIWQAGLLLVLLAFLARDDGAGAAAGFMFDNDRQAAFFFGQPAVVAHASGPGSSATPTSTATWA